jgi:hypothetical protein
VACLLPKFPKTHTTTHLAYNDRTGCDNATPANLSPQQLQHQQPGLVTPTSTAMRLAPLHNATCQLQQSALLSVVAAILVSVTVSNSATSAAAAGG